MLQCLWLTIISFERGLKRIDMAQPMRGQGRGRRGWEPRKAKDSSTSKPHKGRKSVEHLISEVVAAYQEGTNEGIHNLL